MTTYAPPLAIAGLPTDPIGVHGEFKALNHMHPPLIAVAALTTADVINVGYLPPNAVVTGFVIKAATQLDSNGSPTLALNAGVTGTAALFFAAITTVGRAAGASAETGSGLTAAGRLYKNTTGAKQLVTITPSTGAATGVAGTIEAAVTYFVEE